MSGSPPSAGGSRPAGAAGRWRSVACRHRGATGQGGTVVWWNSACVWLLRCDDGAVVEVRGQGAEHRPRGRARDRFERGRLGRRVGPPSGHHSRPRPLPCPPAPPRSLTRSVDPGRRCPGRDRGRRSGGHLSPGRTVHQFAGTGRSCCARHRHRYPDLPQPSHRHAMPCQPCHAIPRRAMPAVPCQPCHAVPRGAMWCRHGARRRRGEGLTLGAVTAHWAQPSCVPAWRRVR